MNFLEPTRPETQQHPIHQYLRTQDILVVHTDCQSHLYCKGCMVCACSSMRSNTEEAILVTTTNYALHSPTAPEALSNSLSAAVEFAVKKSSSDAVSYNEMSSFLALRHKLCNESTNLAPYLQASLEPLVFQQLAVYRYPLRFSPSFDLVATTKELQTLSDH